MKQEQFLKKISTLQYRVERLGIKDDYTEWKSLFDDTISRLALTQAWRILNKHADITQWFLKSAFNTMRGHKKLLGYYRQIEMKDNTTPFYDPTEEIHASIDVKNLMSMLSFDDQVLLYDHYCRGVTAKEIADELSVSVKAIQSRIYRAKTQAFSLSYI